LVKFAVNTAGNNLHLLYGKAGFLEMMELDSPKSPTQKYRPTEKGLEMVNAHE
jgi:hypothetical protein